MKRRTGILLLLALALLLGAGWAAYAAWLAPTRILVVNALPAQQADLVLSNDSRHIRVDCADTLPAHGLGRYDAIVLYGRRLYLTEEQEQALDHTAGRGIPVFTKTVTGSTADYRHNLTPQQAQQLQDYLGTETRQNLRNALRYLRHLATPRRWGHQDYGHPMAPPRNVFYHRQYGQYFGQAGALTDHLRRSGLYHEDGQRLALISGVTFPMEGNRQHVDTLITLLTQRGFNVYPLTATGPDRARMLRELHPDGVVYLAMGRLGGDTLVQWMHQQGIALFCPLPLSMPHDEWAQGTPLSAGTKNARIVIPEIDGAVAPFCIATQRPTAGGYLVHTPIGERCQLLCDYISRYMALRQKPNASKRVAIGYFKRPGQDALLASGMEVIPSLYNFLRRLAREGYDVSGLPATLEQFAAQVRREGVVLGTYAEGAQREYMEHGQPLWLGRADYERWAAQVLAPEQYAEVIGRYGPFPGTLLSRGDSLAVACLRYGNILLFPQPRPALGDDDFRVEHGAEVAPPHSYLAPYLYVQCGFQADALLHFGTHGNLEFTPGRDAAMRPQDWSQQLIGSTPHFYFYTTANIGEAIIAKRRSGAALVTYLTPPYAESGLRSKYQRLHDDIHRALKSQISTLNPQISTLKSQTSTLKSQILREGLHRPLGIDSTLATPLTDDELERLDAHLEELMSEHMQGAYYTLGQPYTDEQLQATAQAMSDDPADHPRLRQLLLQSTQAEMDQMVAALSGRPVAPAPGGDPVMNANVLPTGRNMYSINPESTPDPQAWDDGRRLAEETLRRYREGHGGDYPQKVSYTLWAGEFIATGGATIAQALWMLGVEPLRDAQGRIAQLRVVPARELGRPRVDVVVQVSGQLRDIADSRLKLITEAVRLVTQLDEDYNYVRIGSKAQERDLKQRGAGADEAERLSTLRVFGPANSGYSTGMMSLIERSGQWDDRQELVDAYLNNMCAAYGDDDHWGLMQQDLFRSALRGTAVTVQPRQSNTWGPLSLDHVYEFTGGLSMTVQALDGREPDALTADYRNPRRRRMQDMRQAIDVEARTTLLNPTFIRERMKGDEGTAQMFGETFRNVFGWNATRPSSLDPTLYGQLYGLYILDSLQLGLHDFFRRVNPAALQAMTAVMLESARKGYWQPSAQQLHTTLQLHTSLTRDFGPACTDFVCNNPRLQQFIAGHVPEQVARQYNDQMARTKDTSPDTPLIQPEAAEEAPRTAFPWTALAVAALVLAALLAVAYWRRRQ